MGAEVEVKFLLPGVAPDEALARLARVPLLARRRVARAQLDTVYFDTPEGDLQAARATLRLRGIGEHVATARGQTRMRRRWVQTLKTSGQGGALSARGEWEHAVRGRALNESSLVSRTPWHVFDPLGVVFAHLQPTFETSFQRSSWLLRRRDRSEIELSLDVGEFVAGERRQPLLELELELRRGDPEALLQLAQELAQHLPLLPCGLSKAERARALAEGRQCAPQRARPPALEDACPPLRAARLSMGEMYAQFTHNLALVSEHDTPEAVHQARVGWRRWRSALSLWRPWLPEAPTREGLRPLLDGLSALRDLDVARTETLPCWAPHYLRGDAARQTELDAAQALLDEAAAVQRRSVRLCLARPGTCADLVAMLAWLHGLDAEPAPARPAVEPDWARQRVDRLRHRLGDALKEVVQDDADAPATHAARLQAKRTRYAIESVRSLLPTKRAARWVRETMSWQTRIGNDRDLLRAVVLLRQVQAPDGLLQFLRGVAAARLPGATD